MRLALSKSDEATNGAKPADALNNGPLAEGAQSPKKQTTLNQKVQDQSESQGQNGDTPTGRIMDRNANIKKNPVPLTVNIKRINFGSYNFQVLPL